MILLYATVLYTGSILSRLVEVARQHTQADGVVVYIFD